MTTLRPCARLLEAQSRVPREIVAEAIALVWGVVACYVGLRWGLVGVAWAIVSMHVIHTVAMYRAVRKTIPTQLSDLVRALAPALLLTSLLFFVLAALHWQIAYLRPSAPLLYLTAMTCVGGFAYLCALIVLPIPSIESEAVRWRRWASLALSRLGLRRE